MSRSRWRFYFPKVVIRFGLLGVVALALQLLAVYAPLGPSDIPRRVLLIISYLLLLAFILANLRRPGLVLIGVGLLLNFLAIVSNGGLMPISPDTLDRVGQPAEELSLGDWVPQSKDVLLAREDTHLWFLTDILVWKNPTAISAFSIGDVIIAAGLLITLGEMLLPRPKRVRQPEQSSDYPSFT